MRWIPIAVLATLTALTAGCTPAETPSDTGNAPAGNTASEPATGNTPETGNAPEGGTASAGEPLIPGEGPWAKLDKDKYQVKEGLTYAIIEPGSGQEAKAGDNVVMHYTGWLREGGTKFDSSRDSGQPFDFPLGMGRVIQGWDIGVEGMKVGEKRQLVIPSDLGYGAQGTPGGPIPPNADLVFDVELLEIKGS
ncbi:MAG: FKBP-type peptidyl-prolyl cis-trans isomerase [Armatimonadota bacterium]